MHTFNRASQNRSCQSSCIQWIALQQPGNWGYQGHRSQANATAGCFWGETALLKVSKWQLQSLDILGNFRRGVGISKSTICGLLWKSLLIVYCHPLISAASQTMTTLGVPSKARCCHLPTEHTLDVDIINYGCFHTAPKSFHTSLKYDRVGYKLWKHKLRVTEIMTGHN